MCECVVFGAFRSGRRVASRRSIIDYDYYYNLCVCCVVLYCVFDEC